MILEYLLFSKDLLFIYLLVRPKEDIFGARDRIIEGESVNYNQKQKWIFRPKKPFKA